MNPLGGRLDKRPTQLQGWWLVDSFLLPCSDLFSSDVRQHLPVSCGVPQHI